MENENGKIKMRLIFANLLWFILAPLSWRQIRLKPELWTYLLLTKARFCQRYLKTCCKHHTQNLRNETIERRRFYDVRSDNVSALRWYQLNVYEKKTKNYLCWHTDYCLNQAAWWFPLKLRIKKSDATKSIYRCNLSDEKTLIDLNNWRKNFTYNI